MSEQHSEALVAKLTDEITTCRWSDLKDHVARSAVILVAEPLELVDVAVAVVEDRSAQVGAWVQAGQLTKPTLEQAAHFEAHPEIEFTFVIAQPLVLAKLPTL